MKPTFSIAVRSLVEYVLRSGDLRSDFWSSVQAVEGIRAHQRVQRHKPEGYEAEVPVQGEVEHEDFILSISGRIDGVLRADGRVCIEEIKTTRLSFEVLESHPNPIHWGQGLCYAYLLARQESLSQIEVQLTYAQPDAWKTKTFIRQMAVEELKEFFTDLVSQYMEWMAVSARWARTRDKSLLELTFPFDDYRPGQRALAVEVYRTIRDGDQLIAQAATGIGKTMGVLFPAFKALGEQLIPKVVFLTARTTGRLIAEASLNILRQKGLCAKTVTLTAKEKICFEPDSACLPEECPYAKGYYDRLNQALADAFRHDAFTRERIEELALRHQVCPFEFSLELVNWADGIIGDYNYAFDPKVMLRRLFSEDNDRHAVLVDEAHNLVDRSREMFSAELTKAPVLDLRRKIRDELPGLNRLLSRINSCMATARRNCRDAGGVCTAHEVPLELVDRLRKFITAAEKWLALNIPTSYRDDLAALFFNCVGFIRIAEQYDDCYATIMGAEGDSFSIKLFCIDPSRRLNEAWKRCRAAVLFSATLTPPDYFQSILGCDPKARLMNCPSPFPSENLSVFIAPHISTLYRQRKTSCIFLSRTLFNLVCQHKGHYLFFFPSYEYLELVHSQFVEDSFDADIDVLVQSKEMAEDQRVQFLDRFQKQASQTLVGFAVMGGIFGEGIDLKGDHLTGAVIVGVGLPGICIERDLIRKYFDNSNDKGFEFAYQYPGITRVLQAAGRVIRSEHDRGVILLIDQRYATRRYMKLLPTHWIIHTIGKNETFHRYLINFWRRS